MRALWLGMGLLACCGRAAVCRSECGLVFDGQDCEAFRAAEARAVSVIGEHVERACERLEGWRVRPLCSAAPSICVDEESWVDPHGRKIAGATWCAQKLAQIGSEDFSRNAFAHELIHALECPQENVAHAGWEAWQWRAIERAQSSFWSF